MVRRAEIEQRPSRRIASALDNAASISSRWPLVPDAGRDRLQDAIAAAEKGLRELLLGVTDPNHHFYAVTERGKGVVAAS